MHNSTKKCTGCRKILNRSAFMKAAKGIVSRCRPCYAAYMRKRYESKTPKQRQDYQRKRTLKTYNLTIEQYQELLESVGGLCEICYQPEYEKDVKGRIKPLSVDHNHTTGKIRGLLCSNCNTALGKFRDDSGLLVSAIAYLSKEPNNVDKSI